MNEIIPILTIAFVATNELREWERLPPKHICEHNMNIAWEYSEALSKSSHALGNAGWGLWGQHLEARQRYYVWLYLGNLQKADCREKKLSWLSELRKLINDDTAFFSENWPPPLPRHHFIDQ